jgi:hypothetical protein
MPPPRFGLAGLAGLDILFPFFYSSYLYLFFTALSRENTFRNMEEGKRKGIGYQDHHDHHDRGCTSKRIWESRPSRPS